MAEAIKTGNVQTFGLNGAGLSLSAQTALCFGLLTGGLTVNGIRFWMRVTNGDVPGIDFQRHPAIRARGEPNSSSDPAMRADAQSGRGRHEPPASSQALMHMGITGLRRTPWLRPSLGARLTVVVEALSYLTLNALLAELGLTCFAPP